MQAHLEQLPARLEHLFGLSKLKYEPLDPAKSEIRLLTVVSKPDEPLRCILRKHSLDENPIYFALSYVWGNPSNTKPIIVDGCVFGATINLVEALRHLSNRSHDDGRRRRCVDRQRAIRVRRLLLGARRLGRRGRA